MLKDCDIPFMCFQVDESEASSIAAVTFALTGTISTVLVSIAPLRRLLLRIVKSGPTY